MTYIELHTHSYFSFLDGAAAPETLVARAADLGMPALALTDHNAVYGAVRFSQACRQAGIKPILGAELTLEDDTHLTLLVENEAGWRNLCGLITLAQHQQPKGVAALPAHHLEPHTEGLMALSGCKQGAIARHLLGQDRAAAVSTARTYRELFGPERFWIELQHHLLPEDPALIAQLVALARDVGLGYVATNNVHYPRRGDHQLQDILVCIRHQTRLADAELLLRPNSECYLKSGARLTRLFAAYPQAMANTRRIADRCEFTLSYGLQDLPCFPTPGGLTSEAYLRQVCHQALPGRYPASGARVTAQLGHELKIITEAGLANYFLIVWDLVRFAREQGIPGQGRGSAANSLVAYLLDITPIDPLAHDLVFERFLSAERQVVPDIDLDFCAQRREEVIQYLYQTYGPAHVAMAATLVTFRRRSAIRDIAKVLGLPEPVQHQAAEVLRNTAKAGTPQVDTVSTAPAEAPADAVQLLVTLCRQIQGFPRHLGLHNGGMILTGAPLSHYVPVEPAAMPDRTVVQWDKDDLERVGLIKIDVLGLRMLSAISEAVALIRQTGGPAIDVARLSFSDPAVYAMIAAVDTMGVFQVESRAQSQMLPKLQPRCFADLIVGISLIRPGPIQGNMVRPFLRRRLGLEPVTYPHSSLEPVLKDTLGVILFQEDVLKVAAVIAGFTPGQGEQLRRALGRKHAEQALETFRAQFLAGAEANGVDGAVAETIFEQLKAFGSYSFAKSHAAAFSVLVYQSAWLKRYYPAAFLCGLLNNQPMGFWNPAMLAGDARRHRISLLPVDLHCSQAKCTLEQGQVRLGFNTVKGFGEEATAAVITARKDRAFSSLADCCRRTRLPRRLIEHLILAGAMDGWGGQRDLLWQLGTLTYAEDELDLVVPDDAVDLPALSAAEARALEVMVLGLSTGAHLMTFYRTQLDQQGVLNSQSLLRQPNRRQIRLAGLKVVHQSPPTAKGFHFLTLEDEGGLVDVIVNPQVYATYRQLIHNQALLLIEGLVQHQEGVTNVLARHIEVLTLRPKNVKDRFASDDVSRGPG